MSLITADKLTRRYGSRMGIEDVSLQVGEGVIFGFLGPNGAGKTTAIRILLGFLRPNDGTARIFGLDCWRASPRIKRDVGYLPGDLRLYPWMTLRGALRLAGRTRRMDLAEQGTVLAERFELDMDVPARRMSRGMRQKVGLIMALAPRPRLLVLDEPTSGLDPIMQVRLGAYLREVAGDGCTVLFSSHTLSEVEQLCSHVVILRSGRVVADTTIAALQREARRHVVLTFENDAGDRSLPDGLELLERRGPVWHCALSGSARRLVQWAAGQPLADVSIGRPDLETLFHRYYRDGGA